jgi:ribonuclease HI
MNKVNCITINTDASFHPTHKVGGYAFYIVCDNFKIQKGGSFKINPKNSTEAEMMCMVNALHTLIVQPTLPKTKLIVINSDCLFAFDKIKRRSDHKLGKMIAEKLRTLRILTSYRGVMPEYNLRHVKAHSDNPDARSWVNNWCDQEAKKWMRKLIK